MTDDEIATIDPEHTPTGDELAVLTAFLDYYRAVIVRKAQGLTRDEMNVRLGPSEMTIGGVIKHLAFAEDIWFDHRLAGNEIGDPWARVNWDVDPDWEFHSAVDDEPEALLRLYDAACARSRAAAADVGNLDAGRQVPQSARPVLQPALDPRSHDRRDRPPRRPRRPDPREHRRHHRRLTPVLRSGRPSVHFPIRAASGPVSGGSAAQNGFASPG